MNTTPITTTLNKILKHHPCEYGWSMLLENLGKTQADDEPLKFSTIVHSNCMADAIWCLRSICPEHKREVRLFAADCAEVVLPTYESRYPNDKRPREAIEAARAYANGEIDIDTLKTASNASVDAAMAATSFTDWASARAASRAAASFTDRASARAATWDDVIAATWAAAIAATWAAAGDDVGAVQCKLLINRFS